MVYQSSCISCFLISTSKLDTYQCALVALKFSLVATCTLKSSIGVFPSELDQWGSPYGSTVLLLDGTDQVIELFFLPIKVHPPASIVMSHHTFYKRT